MGKVAFAVPAGTVTVNMPVGFTKYTTPAGAPMALGALQLLNEVALPEGRFPTVFKSKLAGVLAPAVAVRLPLAFTLTAYAVTHPTSVCAGEELESVA